MQGTIAAMRQPELESVKNESALALYQPLSNAASKTRLISRIIHSLPYAWQYRIGSLVTHPDRLRHFCFRKKEIESQARKLLEEGSIGQVVVLGAGLDVLSLRLASEYPSVKFIEIDMHESQGFKIACFHTCQISVPNNVEFIPGDLREPLSAILRDSTLYDIAAKTLWIAEGFFMFIPGEGVAKILKEIRGRCAIGSYVICTSLSSYKPTSALKTILQTFYLHKEASAYQWTIGFNEMASFVRDLGYQLVFQIDYDALQERYRRQKPKQKQDVAESIHIIKT